MFAPRPADVKAPGAGRDPRSAAHRRHNVGGGSAWTRGIVEHRRRTFARAGHGHCGHGVLDIRRLRRPAPGAAGLSGEEVEPADDRRQHARAAAQPPPGYTPTRPPPSVRCRLVSWTQCQERSPQRGNIRPSSSCRRRVAARMGSLTRSPAAPMPCSSFCGTTADYPAASTWRSCVAGRATSRAWAPAS